MRVFGGHELEGDLRRLAERVRCPGLKRRAEAAARAVAGEAPRVVESGEPVHARRIRVEGRELVVLPGCQGKREGLLVVFRGPAALGTLNPLLQRAVGQGLGVLVLPAGVRDVQAGVAAAESTGLVKATRSTFVGLGAGAEDALEAARLRAPERLVLMGALASVFERLAQASDVAEGVVVDAWPLDGARPATTDVHVHRLEATTLDEALGQPTLWARVLPDR